MKNLCNKTRPINNPYEIWGDSPSLPGWTWYVLKKWQADDDAPQARWFCLVKTPIVPEGEIGDVYVKDIKDIALATKLIKIQNIDINTAKLINENITYQC